MEFISKTLFWVANSLLIPDIILLLVLFVRSLMLIGSFYGQYMTKRRTDLLLGKTIKELTPDGLSELCSRLPAQDQSLFIAYLRELLNSRQSIAYHDFLLSGFENRADKDLMTSKVLSKVGPVLGLIGTLIAMSPALVGLSSGDIGGMAYNMQVVFSTTVVGLVISLVGIVTLVVKQRWYSDDLNKLTLVAEVLEQEIQLR